MRLTIPQHNVTLAGNTAGALALVSSGTMTLAGGNAITLSQAGNAVTISGAAGGAGFSAGVSTGGNTAGSTGVTGTRYVLVGTNNITLSQSTDANGGTVSISGAGGGAGQFSGGVSNLGNTAGSTGITGTQLVLVGSHYITLSQSTGPNGGTVSIIPGPKIGFFHNLIGQGDSVADPRRTHAFTGSHGSIGIFPLVAGPLANPFPGLMTCNTFYFRVSLSGSTATMSQAFTSTFNFGIYTTTGSTLSLLNSASATFGFGAAATNNSTGFAGNRYLTIASSQWSSNPIFYPGSVYFLATNWRSSGVLNQSGTFSAAAFLAASNSVSHSGTIGVAAVNATSLGLLPWHGVYTATSAAFPNSIASNQLNKQVNPGVVMPIVIFNEDNPQSF